MAGDDLRRQVFGLDHGAAGGDRRLLERVLELAHVARPVVAQEPRKRLPRERLHGKVLLGHLVEEMIDEERNIFQPLAQGGHFDRNDVEPVEEIFAKPAGGDGLGENHVGGGDDAAIGLDRVGAADALESAVLEHAQQLGLHPQRHLADFVEEESASLRQLEPAFLLAVGAGECPAFVAEELALEKVLGQAPRS